VFLFALIVLCKVESEVREDFSRGRVQYDRVGFRGEDQDGRAGVGPADAEVPEPAGEAEADFSGVYRSVQALKCVRACSVAGAALGVAAWASAGVCRLRHGAAVRGCRCGGTSRAGR
jgi:hypothetical protein